MLPFTPSNPDALLDELADPTLSLHAVAARHRITLDALVLWISTPDVAAKLDSLRNACAARARFVATSFLPTCALHLNTLMETHMADARASAGQTPDHPANQPADLPVAHHTNQAQPLSRARSLESARRAISMLFRIARWQDPRHRLQPADERTRPLAPLPSVSEISAGRGQASTTEATPSLDPADTRWPAPSPSAPPTPTTTTAAKSDQTTASDAAGESSRHAPTSPALNHPSGWRPAPPVDRSFSTTTCWSAHPPPRPTTARALRSHAGTPLNAASTHDARAGPRWRTA
ncbi:MAG: hypothetical protein KF768_00760 [Phycisphaeraceae bacterium]|nr:hypothetical protein [Phycisphaeraceae bacterium]